MKTQNSNHILSQFIVCAILALSVALFGFVCPVVHGQCVPAPLGLVAWWPGDGDAEDIIGDNHGFWTGDEAYDSSGEVGQAFKFDPTDSTEDYVYVLDDDDLDFGLGDSMTIAFWAKSEYTDTYDHHFVSKNTTTYVGNYDVGFNGSATPYFVADLGALHGGIVYSSMTLPTPPDWTHLAAVVDASTSEFRIYFNGTLTGTRSSAYLDTSAPNDASLLIGDVIDSVRPYYGSIDEVMIFNRALSDTEISDIYNAKADGLCKLVLTQAVSIKHHASTCGDLGLNLVLGEPGTHTVETRRDGPTNIIFTFGRDLDTSHSFVDADFGITNATFNGATAGSPLANQLTLKLKNVDDKKIVTVSLLSGIEDVDHNAVGGDTDIEIGAFAGDVNQDEVVDMNDITELGTVTGFDPTIGENCKYDVNLDCSIGGKDQTFVRSRFNLELVSAVSQKIHGAAGNFDLPLALLGTGTIEPRRSNHTTISFAFNHEPFAVDGTFDTSNASVTAPAIVTGVSHVAGTSTLAVTLTGVPDQSAVTVTLNDIEDSNGDALVGDSDVEIRTLLGDVTGNNFVNFTDSVKVSGNIGKPLTKLNFIADLNLDGVISISDQIIVAANKGHFVP